MAKTARIGDGVLFDQVVHHIDLLRYLHRSEFEEVFAMSRSAKWDDETPTVAARLSNGVLASSAFSQGAKAGNELEIHEVARWLRVDRYRFDCLEHASSLSHPGGVKSRLESMGQTARALLQACQGSDMAAIPSIRIAPNGAISSMRSAMIPQ